MTTDLKSWRQDAHMAAQHGATEARHLEIYSPALDQMTEGDFKRAVIDDPILDIAPDFMGFAKTYAYALDILHDHPAINTVVDLGCGKGFQAYAFRDAGFTYVGVDLTPNTIENHASIDMHPNTNIADFCDNLPGNIDPRTTLAIMNAVPGTDNLLSTVRETFPNTLIQYPHHPTYQTPVAHFGRSPIPNTPQPTTSAQLEFN